MTNIFTNGCFDMFHAGHLKILYEAKQLGNYLHVGINSDKSIRKLKGPLRPIINQDQRFEIVSSIKYVDRVYIFDEDTPIELIKQIKPDIIVKGGDWNDKYIVGSGYSKIVTIPLLPDISTSKIIQKIYGKHLSIMNY